MKKIIITSIATLFGIVAVSLPAMAATTATLSPAAVNVYSGGTFNVTVAVNPNGTNNLVEKMVVDYPSNILEVVSFTQAPTWMALTQPGYDSNDPSTGLLTKTAGYPSGITTATNFGTITFRAKQAGNATIKVANGSLAFELNSQTAITGNTISVAIATPTYVPEKSVKATTEVKVTPAVSQASNASSTQIAVAESSGLSAGWMWTMIIILVLAVVGWVMYAREALKKI
jgi:hypothetical protein